MANFKIDDVMLPEQLKPWYADEPHGFAYLRNAVRRGANGSHYLRSSVQYVPPFSVVENVPLDAASDEWLDIGEYKPVGGDDNCPFCM